MIQPKASEAIGSIFMAGAFCDISRRGAKINNKVKAPAYSTLKILNDSQPTILEGKAIPLAIMPTSPANHAHINTTIMVYKLRTVPLIVGVLCSITHKPTAKDTEASKAKP